MNLSELEKDILNQLLHNDVLLVIIKKLFSQKIDKNIPKVNDIDNDLTLGQKYRAYIEAKHIISECFSELDSYKVEKKDEESFNKGR